MNNIIIEKRGTKFYTGHGNTHVILSDDNCIWYENDIYFTQKGWQQHLEKTDYLSESIDKMRDL